MDDARPRVKNGCNYKICFVTAADLERKVLLGRCRTLPKLRVDSLPRSDRATWHGTWRGGAGLQADSPRCCRRWAKSWISGGGSNGRRRPRRSGAAPFRAKGEEGKRGHAPDVPWPLVDRIPPKYKVIAVVELEVRCALCPFPPQRVADPHVSFKKLEISLHVGAVRALGGHLLDQTRGLTLLFALRCVASSSQPMVLVES